MELTRRGRNQKSRDHPAQCSVDERGRIWETPLAGTAAEGGEQVRLLGGGAALTVEIRENGVDSDAARSYHLPGHYTAVAADSAVRPRLRHCRRMGLQP